MSKIDIDKFICFLIENKSDARQLLEVCLKSQGLEYKDGKIVEIDQPSLIEEQKPVTTPGSYDKSLLYSIPKPQTIKFKTNNEEIYQDKSSLFQDSFDALKKRINPDEECIELRDNTGEKVSIPKKKFLERVNVRKEEDDYIWPKDMIDQMHNEIAAGTPKVEAELKKYFANFFPYLYNVDVDKMTRDYCSGLLHSGYVGSSYFDRQIAYKRGIEDILELIKKGCEE